MDHSGPDHIPADAGVITSLAMMLEGWARTYLTIGTCLMGVVVSFAAADTGDALLVSATVALGCVGLVLPLVGLGRRWSAARTWAVVLPLFLILVTTTTLVWPMEGQA